MEKIKFEVEDGEVVEFFVEEQTRINGVNYLLVTETQDEEAEAFILKDISEDAQAEATYVFIEDDTELDAVSKVFEEILEVLFEKE